LGSVLHTITGMNLSYN